MIRCSDRLEQVSVAVVGYFHAALKALLRLFCGEPNRAIWTHARRWRTGAKKERFQPANLPADCRTPIRTAGLRLVKRTMLGVDLTLWDKFALGFKTAGLVK
jgi:hypothetical protein